MIFKKIAYIQANWHFNIVNQAYNGFKEQINSNIKIIDFKVPGALEIPLKAQQIARTNKYNAIICAAFIVDGGIYRHDFVSQTTLDGLMRVSLDENLPILSISLTPHNFQNTPSMVTYFENNFFKKGKETAECLHEIFKNNSL